MKLICPICGKEYKTKPSQVKRGYGKYCSQKCFHRTLMNGVKLTCHQCGKEIYRRKKSIHQSKSGFYFCSNDCCRKWIATNHSLHNHPNWTNGKSSYRDIAIRTYGLKCNRGKKCPLKNLVMPEYMFDAHHKDGNRQNNNIDNLEVLCVYCHREETAKLSQWQSSNATVCKTV